MTGSGLHPLDWGILLFYALGSLVLGWHLSKCQESQEDYYLGGGTLHPVTLGISVFVSVNSTIFFLSWPGETIGAGPTVVIGELIALPIVLWVMMRWFMPTLRKERAISLYSLLERRAGRSVRLLGSALFIMQTFVWMSLLTFMGAKAMVTIMGTGQSSIYFIIPAVTIIALLYSSGGGFRAVVITDLIQAGLLGGGLLLTVGVICLEMNGFSWWPTAWHPNWDSQPLFSFDLTERTTFLGYAFYVLLWNVFQSVGNQGQVQRFMAANSVEEAKRTYSIYLGSYALAVVLVALTGLALLGYVTAFPKHIPPELDIKKNSDLIFPWFIANKLPVGAAGLVVAGMFAAAMSSIDSGVNSVTATLANDFLKPYDRLPEAQAEQLRICRVISFMVGLGVLLGACSLTLVESGFLDLWGKLLNTFMVPLFSVVLFGLFYRNMSPRAIYAGVLAGLIAFPTISWSDKIFGMERPISWVWAVPGAFLINWLVTVVVARLESLTGSKD